MNLPSPAIASILLMIALAGCVGGADPVVDVDGVSVAGDLSIQVAHEGLAGPTQLIVVDEDTFVVATINGGENDRRGQVLRIDARTGETEILRSGLDKPTGVALVDGELWLMERNRLSRGSVAGEPVVVADDLPNNGRSEGTLTVTPDGRILFDTSGSKRGADVVDGSGRLFTVDPGRSPGPPVELASGFKHAYAHVFDDAGTLWTTEMTDGSFDGEPAEDELVAVTPGADHGWPRCVGDNRPVAEFGGDPQACSGPPRSVALFDPGATPTSVVVSPFEADTLLVALWAEGRIVSVDTTGLDPLDVEEVVAGLAGPQHLVATEDAVYITEFGAGRILRLSSG